MVLETYLFLLGCLFYGHVNDFKKIHWSIINLQRMLPSAIQQSELVIHLHISGFPDSASGKEQET